MSSSGLAEVDLHRPQSCCVEHLSSEDIEFFRRFRRTFECVLLNESSRPEDIIPELNPRSKETLSRAERKNHHNLSKEPDIRIFKKRDRSTTWVSALDAYELKSLELIQEADDLRQHLIRIGGERTLNVVQLMSKVPERISNLSNSLEGALRSGSDESIVYVVDCLMDFEIRFGRILRALGSQKHAFLFRHFNRLQSTCQETITSLKSQTNTTVKIEFLFDDMVPRFTRLFANVAAELRTFSEQVLPSSALENEERATTRYLALTTIATFFSSVTATTLQFSYQQTAGHLGSAVNLFWFLSLVFSVSSGINSLLSMIWRKSSVYSNTRPPGYIVFWLTKASVIFLAISAFAFMVGLNLFVYSSKQSNYVSIATTVFTALHVLGLLAVTSWFFVRLKWNSSFVQSVRRHLLWVFLREDELFHLNAEIAAMRHWPDNPPFRPYPLARLLRYTVKRFRAQIRTFRKILETAFCWLKRAVQPLPNIFKHAHHISAISIEHIKRFLRRMSPRRSRRRHPNAHPGHNDLEVGGNDREEKDIIGPSSPYAVIDEIAEEFISLLHEVLVEDFRLHFLRWKNNTYSAASFEIRVKNKLWGYPHIVQHFMEKVLPVLQAVEEQRKAHLFPEASQPIASVVPLPADVCDELIDPRESKGSSTDQQLIGVRDTDPMPSGVETKLRGRESASVISATFLGSRNGNQNFTEGSIPTSCEEVGHTSEDNETQNQAGYEVEKIIQGSAAQAMPGGDTSQVPVENGIEGSE